MKKVLIAMALAVVLVSLLIAPALADQGGVPNENAGWGQAVKASGPMGEHSSNDYTGFKDNPKMWGAGGIPGNHP
jgi:opacity protein-like surface antigen